MDDGSLGRGSRAANRPRVARRGGGRVRGPAPPPSALRHRARWRALQRRRVGVFDGGGARRDGGRALGRRPGESHQLRACRPERQDHHPRDAGHARAAQPAVGRGGARRAGPHRLHGARPADLPRARLGAGRRSRRGEARVTAGGRVLVVLTCAAACAGCFLRRERPHPTGPPVDYVRRKFESSLAGCNDGHGAAASWVGLRVGYDEAPRARLERAHAGSGFVAAGVLRPVGDAPQPASVEELRDDLYASYRDIQQDTPDYRVPWEMQREITVACNTERVQGLVAKEHTFLGGARPVDRVRYQSFDTTTGQRVGLDAVVAPEQREKLVDELEQRRRGGAASPASGGLWDRQAATTRLPGATEPDSVLVCPDALTFRWNDGGVEVVVARDEILPLLRTDAP